MQGTSVIVTGCSGYIGSVLCKMLKEQGSYVIGFDLEVCKHNYVDEFVNECISSTFLSRFAIENKVSIIFHLAATADVGLSVSRPELFYHNNIGNTSHMLMNLIDWGWKGHIVFSSSAAVYGEPVGVAEVTSPTIPVNSYGTSKLICEDILHQISNLHDIKVTCFRYFNVAGAWDDVGDHLDSGHIIQRLCRSAKNKISFKLFGEDYPTKDGSCVRDYVHVIDICRAHVYVAFTRQQQKKFEVYNLGSGVGFTNKEVVAAFERFCGVDIDLEIVDRRPGDPAILIAGPTYFTFTTGFQYRKSSLESIITSAWNYYI